MQQTTSVRPLHSGMSYVNPHPSTATPPDVPDGADDFDRPVDSFDRFVRAHIRTVRRLALARVGPDTADDVVSEAFATAWKHYKSQSSTPTEAWLLATTVNHCRMRLRSDRTWLRRLRQSQSAADSWPAFDDEAIARLDATGAHHQILAAFRDLPDAEREVIALAALSDLTPVEISSILGRPRGSVRSLLFRARAHLAAALAPEDDHHE